MQQLIEHQIIFIYLHLLLLFLKFIFLVINFGNFGPLFNIFSNKFQALFERLVQVARIVQKFLEFASLDLKSKSCVFHTFLKRLEHILFNMIQIPICPFNTSLQLDLIQFCSPEDSFHFIDQACCLLILGHGFQYKNGKAKNYLFILLPLCGQDSLFLASSNPINNFLDNLVHVFLNVEFG